MTHEEPLQSGATSGIVRIGDTIRRPTTESSATIHALLIHLEQVGFAGSPRFLGIDAQGRETLSFIPGEAGHYGSPAHDWSDSSLEEAMRLLREYHDAASSFAPPESAIWRSRPAPSEEQETICHNDIAPYNCIFQNERPVAFIDFDLACPGSRRWDFAHAAFRFVPLSQAEDRPASLADADVERRLALACDAYGLTNRSALIDAIERRVTVVKDSATTAAAGTDANAMRIRRERHVERYERDLAFIREMRSRLRQAVR